MKNTQEVVDEVLLNVGYAAKIDNVPDAMKLIMETATNDRRLIIKALLHRMHELGFLEGLRQVSQNMITWHDPEKEKPISGEAVILVGRNDFYWDAGYYMHPDEAKNVNRAIGWYFSSHEPVVGEIAWWGTFELPEIEEVEG